MVRALWMALPLILPLLPAPGSAQTKARWPPERVRLAIGPVTVGKGEEVGALVAIGPIAIEGKVEGDVVSIGGRVDLQPSAVVAGNVTGVCASVDVAEGAQVAGDVKDGALPEMARTSLSLREPAGEVLIIGSAEITGPHPRRAIVLGGDVIVREGAGVQEIAVIGGDLTIDAGTQVKTARVAGGRLTRAASDADAKDEGTESVKLAAYSPGAYKGELHIAAFGRDWQLDLFLAAKAVGRRPLPKGKSLSERRPGAASTGWDSWPRTQMWAPAEADPAFKHSIGLGVGVNIDVVVEDSADERHRSVQRTITLAVPSDAGGLVREAAEY